MVEHEKTYKDIPTVALRGLVVLPGEMLHFDAGRPKSVHALNRAMDEEGLIFVSAQKDPKYPRSSRTTYMKPVLSAP